VPVLLDQPEAAPLGREHQREVRLLDDGVDAGRAVHALDVVLPQPQPGVAVDLPAPRRPHDPSLART
jgi:hypothetical protein